jgi:hypothetical protein
MQMLALSGFILVAQGVFQDGLMAQVAGGVKADTADKTVKADQPKAVVDPGIKTPVKTAEEKPADTAVRVEKPADTPREADKPLRSVEAPRYFPEPMREVRPVEVRVTPEPAQADRAKDDAKKDQPIVIQNLPGGDGLVDFGEGVYKYKRIPGIKLSDPALAGREIKPAKDEDADKESSGKGLLGMSQRATDIAAKIILVAIIIVVFVLYRFRSGGRRSSVLKRFPRA